MFFNSSKIIETLATIKANTSNHKDDLKEFKETFNKHIEKEEIRYVKLQKEKERELIAVAENKADEIKERATADKKFGEDIASLQSRSKYNLLSMAGLWTVMAVMLKKLFS